MIIFHRLLMLLLGYIHHKLNATLYEKNLVLDYTQELIIK